MCVRQSSDAGLTSDFMSGSDKCLGELLYSTLQTVEDCEIRVVDCTEDMLTARQIRSPVHRLLSPMKVLWLSFHLSVPLFVSLSVSQLVHQFLCLSGRLQYFFFHLCDVSWLLKMK